MNQDIIEISNGDLNNIHFDSAIRKLDKLDAHQWVDPVNDIRTFNKIKYRQEKEIKNAKTVVNGLIGKYAKHKMVVDTKTVDPAGNIERDPNTGLPVWEDEQAFMNDHERLMAEVFTLKCSRIAPENMVVAGLNPTEWRACSMIIAGEPDLEDNEDEQPVNIKEAVAVEDVVDSCH